jgi:tetratricopeptide (TPR) repeat protein
MKKFSLSFLIVSLCIGLTFANQFEQAMSGAIQKLYNANDRQSYMDAIATFERIGAKENDQWLPQYYAGLGYIWASHTTKDGQQIDGLLDKAQVFVDKAKKLSPDNDEILTLQGYIYMMKVVVDPPTRGPQFSGLALQTFGRAVEIDKRNPRALLFLGRMQMGTDQFFGNDTSKSYGMIMKASQMLNDEKPKSALDPAWGKQAAEGFVNECLAN